MWSVLQCLYKVGLLCNFFILSSLGLFLHGNFKREELFLNRTEFSASCCILKMGKKCICSHYSAQPTQYISHITGINLSEGMWWLIGGDVLAHWLGMWLLIGGEGDVLANWLGMW